MNGSTTTGVLSARAALGVTASKTDKITSESELGKS